ncbi:cyclic dehypoxanthinyl futalosine synthase [Metallumcola ferriviriculae]|uniref:cyclic dehypoxanthinyl futalosine synthase n=1 Tax=Metallumcola ferriviriculae TaxID=3039180 RepID=UPI003457D1EE
MLSVEAIFKKAVSGERVSESEAVKLFNKAELLPLGKVALEIRNKIKPEPIVSFVIDRNINYTNICLVGCRFCAFYRGENHNEGYVITEQQLFEKIQETIDHGGTQILMQGGLNPHLKFNDILQMLQNIKNNFDIHIHSFSPPEVVHFSQQAGLTIKETLERLRSAGLDSLPGGGAEILVDRVRKYISPRKISWKQWMNVMDEAHQLGMKTTATMMFGSVETIEERVKHMIHVRDQQDKTGGFTAFIPWSFQPSNTALGGLSATGHDYLKTLAIARIVLDNVPNIQASWVTQGAKMAQVSLFFGANDFGGTMFEENVVRAAGVSHRVPLDEIIHCIKDAGYNAVQRRTDYSFIKAY